MTGPTMYSGRTALAALMLCAALIIGQPVAAQAAPARDDTTYVVRPGDRLVDIAARYGVTPSAIVQANNLANADTIFPGQQLIIPAGEGAVAPEPATAGSPASQETTHTVKLGDTLAKIAQ